MNASFIFAKLSALHKLKPALPVSASVFHCRITLSSEEAASNNESQNLGGGVVVNGSVVVVVVVSQAWPLVSC
jgi:hypothetical protein